VGTRQTIFPPIPKFVIKIIYPDYRKTLGKNGPYHYRIGTNP
jgi:hypothetical protein